MTDLSGQVAIVRGASPRGAVASMVTSAPPIVTSKAAARTRTTATEPPGAPASHGGACRMPM